MSNRLRHGYRPKTGPSETRKEDRWHMAMSITELCSDHGVRCHLASNKYDRWHKVTIEADTGLSVVLEFDRDSIQPNIFVLSWHFRILDNDWRVNPEVFRDHNDVHFRKATDVVHGWEDLRRLMQKRLKQIADGTATITTEQLNAYTDNRTR